MDWLTRENIELAIVILGIIFGADGIAGYLPDKWVNYIGVIRRIFPKIVDAVKKNPKAVIIALCCVCMVGCSAMGLKKPKSVCDSIPPGESVLCDLASKNDVHIDTIGNLIAFQNIDAIERNEYTAAEAIGFLLGLRMKINITDGLTAMDIAAIAREKLGRRGAAGYLLLSPYIGVMDVPEVLKAKDKELLEAWIDSQVKFLGE